MGWNAFLKLLIMLLSTLHSGKWKYAMWQVHWTGYWRNLAKYLNESFIIHCESSSRLTVCIHITNKMQNLSINYDNPNMSQFVCCAILTVNKPFLPFFALNVTYLLSVTCNPLTALLWYSHERIARTDLLNLPCKRFLRSDLPPRIDFVSSFRAKHFEHEDFAFRPKGLPLRFELLSPRPHIPSRFNQMVYDNTFMIHLNINVICTYIYLID